MTRRFCAVSIMLLALVVPLCAQTVTSGELAAVPQIDIDDLVSECQQTIKGKDRTGIIWWIPVEFWEASFREQGGGDVALKNLESLRAYTMVVVAGGTISGFGSITWLERAVLAPRIRLKDASGKEHEPHKTVSGDAAVLAAVIRPVLANALGPMGQHMEVFMFPSRNAAGVLIADPQSSSSFSVVLHEIEGFGSSEHEWRLPLTSLSPPKLCPVVKEKLQANWRFCPWHGVALNDVPAKEN